MAGMVWLVAFSIGCSFARGQLRFLPEHEGTCSLSSNHVIIDEITLNILRALQGIGGAAVIPAAVRSFQFEADNFKLTDFFRKSKDWDFGRGFPSFSGPINSLCYFRSRGADR